MDRMQMNTVRRAGIIDAIASGAGTWVCAVARRRAGGKVQEKWTVGGGNVRFEINGATQLIPPNL